MALNTDSAYPTFTDMAKRLAQQRRQRTATTGREETYDEGVAITEGAIRAGLAARDRNIPFKLEKERMLEQKRQFDISGARQEEQYRETFDENTRRYEDQKQREDEAAESKAIASMAVAGGSIAGLAAGSAGWLSFLGIGAAGTATTTAGLAAATVATGGALAVGAAAGALLYGIYSLFTDEGSSYQAPPLNTKRPSGNMSINEWKRLQNG